MTRPGRMNPTTFYRALRHAERNGLCRSEWETNKTGPPRRVYSTMDAGEAYLGNQLLDAGSYGTYARGDDYRMAQPPTGSSAPSQPWLRR